MKKCLDRRMRPKFSALRTLRGALGRANGPAWGANRGGGSSFLRGLQIFLREFEPHGIPQIDAGHAAVGSPSLGALDDSPRRRSGGEPIGELKAPADAEVR